MGLDGNTFFCFGDSFRQRAYETAVSYWPESIFISVACYCTILSGDVDAVRMLCIWHVASYGIVWCKSCGDQHLLCDVMR